MLACGAELIFLWPTMFYIALPLWDPGARICALESRSAQHLHLPNGSPPAGLWPATLPTRSARRINSNAFRDAAYPFSMEERRVK